MLLFLQNQSMLFLWHETALVVHSASFSSWLKFKRHFFLLPEVVKMSIKPRNGEFYLMKSSLEYHEVIMCVYCFPEQQIKTWRSSRIYKTRSKPWATKCNNNNNRHRLKLSSLIPRLPHLPLDNNRRQQEAWFLNENEQLYNMLSRPVLGLLYLRIPRLVTLSYLYYQDSKGINPHFFQFFTHFVRFSH